MYPTIFLDIDGVLNSHTILQSGYCGICVEKAHLFNTVLDTVPDARIIISSAWRYLILRGDMTLKGFEYLLLVSGIKCRDRVIGHTGADQFDDNKEPAHDDLETWSRLGLAMRAKQILDRIKLDDISRYCVIDDLDIQVPHLVKTDGRKGLTEYNCREAITFLTHRSRIINQKGA